MTRSCAICGKIIDSKESQPIQFLVCGDCFGQPHMGPAYVIRSKSSPKEIADRIRDMISRGVISPWDPKFLPPDEETFEPPVEWFPGKDEDD